MRGGDKFQLFYSYNPPKSQANWINREVTIQALRSDTLVHHSDYRDVPEAWLGAPFLQEAEQLQKMNPVRYQHEYLGEITGTGGEIFQNITQRIVSQEERAHFDSTKSDAALTGATVLIRSFMSLATMIANVKRSPFTTNFTSIVLVSTRLRRLFLPKILSMVKLSPKARNRVLTTNCGREVFGLLPRKKVQAVWSME